jgi:large subunit ribosomal protein L10
MATQKKIEAVAQLKDLLERGTVIIGADYRGLSVADVTTLRRQLREAGIEMHVIKNTLFQRAANEAGKPDLIELAEGPTALVIGYDDPVTPVRTLVEYQRTARNTFAARKAYLEGTIFSGPRLAEIATLPPKDQLIAQVAGALQSPVVNLVSLLAAAVQEFSGLLDARTEQLEGAA